jgi:hypothetical protein
VPKDANFHHPIWELYDLHRESCYLAKLYQGRAEFLLAVSFWSDVVTAIFAGSSAVAGFAMWKSGAGAPVWAIGAGLAALISTLKPVLRLNEKVKQYESLGSAYTDLMHECKIIGTRVKNESGYSQAHMRATLAAQENARKLAGKTPVWGFSLDHRRAVQAEVNRELPKEIFFIPPLNGNGVDKSKERS